MRAGREEMIAGAITSALVTFFYHFFFFQLTIACTLLHIPIIFVVLTRKNCKGSFFKICAARSIGHIFASLTVGVSCTVALITNRQFLSLFINGYYFTLNFLFLSELIIAVNRYIAVSFWTKSAKIFSEKKTILYITMLALLSVGRAAISIRNDCYARFLPKQLTMEFNVDSCDAEIILMAVMEIIMFFGFALNLLTLYKLVLLHRKGVGQDRSAKDRLRQNMTHFSFTFAQSIIWMIVGMTIVIRSTMFMSSPYVHFVFEDLFEFIGSVAEGLLFWWLHGRQINMRTSFGSGNSGTTMIRGKQQVSVVRVTTT